VLDEVKPFVFTRALEIGLQNLLREATVFPQNDLSMRQIAILLICAQAVKPLPVTEIANELGTDVKGIGAPIRALVRQRQIRLRKQPGRGSYFDIFLTRYGHSFAKELWNAAQGNVSHAHAVFADYAVT